MDAELLDSEESISDLLCAAGDAVTTQLNSPRATMFYDDAGKNMALGFKHGNRIHMPKTSSQWMYQAGNAFFTSRRFYCAGSAASWPALKSGGIACKCDRAFDTEPGVA